MNEKKIIGHPNFSDLFKRIVDRFKQAVYILCNVASKVILLIHKLEMTSYLYSVTP